MRWYFKGAFFKTLVKNSEAIALKAQELNSITALAYKNIDITTEHPAFNFLFNLKDAYFSSVNYDKYYLFILADLRFKEMATALVQYLLI